MRSNYLKAAIKKNGDTQQKLAEQLGLCVSGLNDRINGKIEFRLSEVEQIIDRYRLSPQEITEIFFDKAVS